MEYTMGTKLVNISLEMKIVKMLCKINEYKGQQILYKKQPKNVVSKTTDEAISNFVYDTYIDKFSDNKEKLIK